ncbi:hypothetical protein FPV67DRAFT_1673524 [Lyophyllum atratum]|nr:hypothetical protein FPV67DRAFT_1674695 [Lyophyllum atratum]KAF8060674.1 hypothetical protein FPV67DRAFT_1673524 [Lyophyllum atratum]
MADSDNREISAIRFSPDGKYMATGDRAGIVLIYKGPVEWWTLRNYRATSCIQSFAWHPQKEGKLLIGCANGDINTLLMAETDQMTENDVNNYVNFDGLINFVEYSRSGTRVAVVWGRIYVSLYEDGCQQPQDASPMPVAQLLDLACETTPVQSIHFVGDEKLIVCGYSREMGIGVFSTSPPYQLVHRVQLRNEGHAIGASALSPLQTMLAVTNLSDDGVDFYSLETWSHYGAVAFDNSISWTLKTSIQFIDQESIVVGHQRGGLIYARVMPTGNGVRVRLDPDENARIVTRVVATGWYEGKVILAAATFCIKGDVMRTGRGPRTSVLRYLSNAEEESTSVKRDPSRQVRDDAEQGLQTRKSADVIVKDPQDDLLFELQNVDEESTSVERDPSEQVHDDAEQGLQTRKSAYVVLKNAEEESKSVAQDPPEQVYHDAAQGRQTRKSADVAVEDPHFRTEWKPCVALLLYMFATGVVIVVIYYVASRRPGTPLPPSTREVAPVPCRTCTEMQTRAADGVGVTTFVTMTTATRTETRIFTVLAASLTTRAIGVDSSSSPRTTQVSSVEGVTSSMTMDAASDERSARMTVTKTETEIIKETTLITIKTVPIIQTITVTMPGASAVPIQDVVA